MNRIMTVNVFLAQDNFMKRDIFFKNIKNVLFAGKFTQPQVDGLDAILTYWETGTYSDLRHLAYILATAYHETGKRMQPIRECFALTDEEACRRLALKPYSFKDPITEKAYFGRGLVQLTWKENYKRMSKYVGLDLVANPDYLLDMNISIQVLFEGMLKGESNRGDFTGVSLETYFNAERNDPINARKIINGTDKAGLIAMYHHHFLEALNKANI